MAAEGYTGLVNMEGGFHGAFDQTGAVVEAGWAACGFEQTTTPDPERTWQALRPS
jgi:hypothetical protein